MNKEEIQSLLKEYEPIGNSDTEKLINLLNIWIKEGHLLLNESNRQDELYKILEAILSSIPTHKDETKTHDIFCATNYFKDVHRGIKFTHCTCLEQSVPQPLKPLSDKEIETIFHENCRSGSVDINKSEIEPVLTFEDYKDCLKEISKLFSLPVDNTVSETETIDFWKIQNNSLQELITEKDLEIAKLKMSF